VEYIRGNNITFRYEGQSEAVLEGVSFSLSDNGRIGLVGDNGCGKTTLVDVMRGKLPVIAGDLVVHKEITIGHLPQEVRLGEELSVEDYLWQARDDLYSLKKRLDTAEGATADYAELVSEFYAAGGDVFRAEMEKVYAGFDLEGAGLGTRISTLSGGEKTKTALARLLLARPDVMLLDEPTNHLEIASLVWLEQYLAASSIPYVIVSHDRRFLDQCVTEIWELHEKGLLVYPGAYSDFRREKERRRERQAQQYETQQQTVERLRTATRQKRHEASKMEKFKLSRSVTKKGGICKRDDGSGRTVKPSAKMRSAKAIEKRIDRMLEKDRVEKPRRLRPRKISLTESDVDARVVLRIEGLSMAFGPHTVFENVSLAVGNGVKLGIIGRNGSGKTVLLKIITGNLPPTAGSYRWNPQAQIGYFAQEYEKLDDSRTILDEVLQGKIQDQTRARTILGRLNIRRDMVYRTIDTLSLGERSKVALAQILFSDAGVLVLDEPTNHMELSAREALEEALVDYDGAVIIASHDRYLLERVATEIYDVEKNVHYAGDYADYCRRDSE